MMSVTLTSVAVLLSVMLARAVRRRRGRHDPFDLGTVSQQWLLIHKGEDR